jgi:TM2 domain-containing membrane protein YozV
MAETKTAAPPVAHHPITAKSIVVLVLGWLLPGAGHFMLRRWIRGLLLFISVIVMFTLGIMMQGKIYSANAGDILDMLGFVGDVGSGVLYFAAQIMDLGRGAIHIAVADYGTKFIIVAGLLNIMAAIDAHHIAIGKKA